MRDEFKASDVEITNDLSVDTQKAWNKSIKALDLVPLGKGNGHRVYSLIDLLFLELIQLLKTRGLSVASALSLVLGENSQAHAGGAIWENTLRHRLTLVFASHLVRAEMDSDVMLYVPMYGLEQWQYHSHLSARPAQEGRMVVGADPAINLQAIMELDGNVDHVLSINVSRLAERFIRRMEEHYNKLLDQLDGFEQFVKLALEVLPPAKPTSGEA